MTTTAAGQAASYRAPPAAPAGVDTDQRSPDATLVEVLTPTVELAIRQSVRRDPRPLAEAIFPVIGPAIRKAVAAAIGGLVEAINQAAELAFTVDGIRWRIEAWRAGKSFGEVVVAHRLRYQVEQLFFIQRDSGLLLAHVARSEVVAPDIVSGMLTAVQQFVRDSFDVARDDALHTLRVGDVTVLVEHGPVAALAAVVRGHTPRAVGAQLEELVEELHRDFGYMLGLADAGAATLGAIEPRLRDGLVAELSPMPKHRGRWLPLVTVAAVFLVLVGAWGVRTIMAHSRWSAYLSRLGSTPGVVVVESGRRDGRWFISGLRDPLAVDPLALLDSVGIPPGTVDARWRSYLALDPSFLLARAQAALAPPTGVALAASSGTIRVSGAAPHMWIERAQSVANALGIPLDTRALRDRDHDALTDEASAIAQIRVRFPVGSAQPAAEEQRVADSLVRRVRELATTARAAGASVDLVVVGRTDETGSERANAALASARAAYLQGRLTALGISSQALARPAAVSNATDTLTRRDTLGTAARSSSILVEVRRARP